jgi:hypothetical protein
MAWLGVLRKMAMEEGGGKDKDSASGAGLVALAVK